MSFEPNGCRKILLDEIGQTCELLGLEPSEIHDAFALLAARRFEAGHAAAGLSAGLIAVAADRLATELLEQARRAGDEPL